MSQSFVPFPTAMMGEYPTNPLAVSMLAVVMVVITLLFVDLRTYILQNPLKPEFAGSQDPHIVLKSCVGPLSYLLGVAAAASPWAIWTVTFSCCARTISGLFLPYSRWSRGAPGRWSRG